MQFTPSQQQALDIERHICVTAGAGSGKTAVLVGRYLKILREGNATPRDIVAITFTDKAAAEMKDRIIEELSHPEKDGDGSHDNSLQHFRDQMNTAHISTIHAFCSRILREFPFQARVPANFSILHGIEQKLSLQQTISDTLKEIATTANHAHRPALSRLLQRYGGQQKLVDFFVTMIGQRDLLENTVAGLYSPSNNTEVLQKLTQRIREIFKETIDIPQFMACLNAVLEVAKSKRATTVRDLTDQISGHSDAADALDILTEIACLITTKSNEISKLFLGRNVDTADLENEIKTLVETAKQIKTVPSFEATDENENPDSFLISTTRDLLSLYRRVLNAYQQSKLSQGKLDYDDLQLKTRDLLRTHETVRETLVARHKYYMIDEYQDTNKLQSELVMLLTNCLDGANLFIVGDPKQSIYAFRGADVRVFEETEKKIEAKNGRSIDFTENFRSLRDVIGLVNTTFEGLMGEGKDNEFEVKYTPLTLARPDTGNGGVEILVEAAGEGAPSESTLIAQRIRNMRAGEETVWGRDEDGQELERPLQYGDIAILIRSRRHLPDIEKALLEAEIPYLTTGGVGFYQRQEIYDIWNYLHFLAAPAENQVSLAAVLRGPAFGISDAELYEISRNGGENFWEKARTYQGSTHLQRAIATLQKHLQVAHRMRVNRLILTLVNETGMIGTLKTGRYGRQRWANYQKLLELARNFDGDEKKQTLPNFVEFLDTLITEEPQEGNAPIETDGSAVQIMTIHAAKGQQFPVVFLPRLNRQGQMDREPFIDETLGIGFSPLNPEDAYAKTEPALVRYLKNRAEAKAIAEQKRLLYVGITRARDRLILSGTCPPKHMLEWIYTHLEINEENTLKELPTSLEVYRDGSTNPHDFHLRIPMRSHIEDIPHTEDAEDETVEFPVLPQDLAPAETPATFFVAELANYARCPLRYQLENVLRTPTNTEENGDEINAALRQVLTRLRHPSDVKNRGAIIAQVLKGTKELTDNLTDTLHRAANLFINSELGKNVLSASTIHTYQQIHADIHTHIITGTFHTVFKDSAENWQAIRYEKGEPQDANGSRPEMELYGLLLHRCYPTQASVIIHTYYPEQGQFEQARFNPTELQTAEEQWQERILALQQGVYQKNLKHCPACPYADADGECIIASET